MTSTSEQLLFPALPLEEWEQSKITLHLYTQIVGKVRLALFPHKNHWWNVPLYVSGRGLTTRTIPFEDRVFEITFDFISHKLVITCSDGAEREISLFDGLTVAEFYEQFFAKLEELGITVQIKATPYDVPGNTEPFPTDRKNHSYQKEYIHRFWQILVQVDSVFQEFRGRFIGKCTPVHLFWHHLDLALTRFSGKKGPEREGISRVEREAYSHEVISFGFWAGDENVREPAFYAYSYPVPEGLMDEPLKPAEATWNEEAGMALLMYNDVRSSASPRQSILDFLESVYQAGANRAGWDVEAFDLKNC